MAVCGSRTFDAAFVQLAHSWVLQYGIVSFISVQWAHEHHNILAISTCCGFLGLGYLGLSLSFVEIVHSVCETNIRS